MPSGTGAQAQEAWARMPHSRNASNAYFTNCCRSAPVSRLCLGDEGRGVLLHQTEQRGLLRAVALVVDRGAIGRPAGPPRRGLHALLMSEPWYFTVSNRAAHRHCPLWRLLAGAHLKVSTGSAGAARRSQSANHGAHNRTVRSTRKCPDVTHSVVGCTACHFNRQVLRHRDRV